MSDTVSACPDCDTASVQYVGAGHYCTTCGATFAEPETRDRKRAAHNGIRGPGKQLLDADPGAWP